MLRPRRKRAARRRYTARAPGARTRHVSCVAKRMTKTDEELKRAIAAELAADPKVNAAQIAVIVDQCDVSLRGTVDTHAERSAAVAATRRVGGVRAVAQRLTLRVQSDATGMTIVDPLTETEIVDQNEMMN
jgi:osmotically-inducible protein OsmY